MLSWTTLAGRLLSSPQLCQPLSAGLLKAGLLLSKTKPSFTPVVYRLCLGGKQASKDTLSPFSNRTDFISEACGEALDRDLR